MSPRLRTLTLWTGTLLSLLIAAVFVVSAWWWVVFQVPTSHGPTVYLIGGSAMIVADRMQSVTLLVKSSTEGLRRWNDWHGEWSLASTVPVYALFVAVAIPTLLVWRFWPKPIRPGHCECGYDLPGNTSGVCRECGREAMQ